MIALESRRRSTQWLLGAAAAVVAVVAASALVAQRGNDTDVLAAIDITSEGLDGAPVGLNAMAVVELVDGHRQLKVGAADFTIANDEFLELWLINGDVTDMVSLGTFTSLDAQHTYAIPDDVDLDTFPIVDVSIEPTDGDPSHSGHSVLRGRLDA